MLGGKDQRTGARVAGGAGPLAGVQRGGIEQGGGFAPVAPLAVGEGIDSEMEEQRHLVALPGELRGDGRGRSCSALGSRATLPPSALASVVAKARRVRGIALG